MPANVRHRTHQQLWDELVDRLRTEWKTATKRMEPGASYRPITAFEQVIRPAERQRRTVRTSAAIQVIAWFGENPVGPLGLAYAALGHKPPRASRAGWLCQVLDLADEWERTPVAAEIAVQLVRDGMPAADAVMSGRMLAGVA